MMIYLFSSVFLSFFVSSSQNIIAFLCFLFVMLMLSYPVYFDYLSYSFYMDNLSFFLIYLTIWILILMVSASGSIYKSNYSYHYFNLVILMLLVSLILAFLSNSLLSFYFFFEFSIIPTAMLIMGWGYQVERVQAFTYFLIYTLFSSLPLLLMVVYLSSNLVLVNFYNFLGSVELVVGSNCLTPLVISVVSVGAFLVKMPMYLFHLWLPKAHVEAPVSGSMILAGVLLKLGGYGIVRVSLFFKKGLVVLAPYIVGISLTSLVFVGFICLRNNDMKSLVAYSSVSHMGICITGLVTFFFYGYMGGLLMLIGHGVCSSGMFYYINVLYERSGSRSLFINKGLSHFNMSCVLFSFLISVINMSAPPTMNLFSEVYLFVSVLGSSLFLLPTLVLGSFLVACYSIFFFSFSHHGASYTNYNSHLVINSLEYLTLSNHLTPLVLSFLFIFYIF
uniref:NADH-ubiquinone oxidoreductase chain 4 n=1 Tax=Sminthurides bifidus TaxID=2584528 RepID=A0A6H0EW41_9HEXA|nr:NADH dehydrogenase subunit 4 [Sminthurides bifidus]